MENSTGDSHNVQLDSLPFAVDSFLGSLAPLCLVGFRLDICCYPVNRNPQLDPCGWQMDVRESRDTDNIPSEGDDMGGNQVLSASAVSHESDGIDNNEALQVCVVSRESDNMDCREVLQVYVVSRHKFSEEDLLGGNAIVEWTSRSLLGDFLACEIFGFLSPSAVSTSLGNSHQ